MRTQRVASTLAVMGLTMTLVSCETGAGPGEAGRAGVVVIHGDGSVRTACVDLAAGSSGVDLLRAAGWGVSLDASNPMGVLVCGIDGEGCEVSLDPCFCACPPGHACSYWAYFVREPGSDWTYAPLGASARQAADRSMDAWVWLTSAGAGDTVAPLLADLTFEGVCDASD